MDMDMPMTPPSSMSNCSSMDMMMMMHMTFYWGKDVNILFSGWPNKNLGMYILALFFVFFLAFALEVLSIISATRFGSNPVLGAVGQAGFYAVRMGLAYLVMLSVMSYNLGVFIVAVAGHAIGFFIVKARSLDVSKQTNPDVVKTEAA